MEENELYNRIGETDLNPTYKDGQTYQHTDINQMLGILKTAINENYYDIQRLLNGGKIVGNAKKLDGATLSRYIDEELQSDDNKIPSSQQAKAYMDALFAGYSAPVRGVDYWTEADQQQIVSDTASNVIEEITPDLEEALSAKANINDIPTKISDLQNDSDFLSENNLQMTNTGTVQNETQLENTTGYSRVNKIFGNSSQATTPSPTNPVSVYVVKGDVNLTIKNADNTLSNTFLLSLGDIELCKVGTYKDYIYYQNNKWFKYKKIKKFIFNGTENWQITNSSNGKRFQIGLSNILDTTGTSTVSAILSSHFKAVSATNTWNNVVGISYRNPDVSGLYIYDGTHTVLADFKTWLSNNNVTVYCVLKEPVIEEITNITLLNQLNAIRNILLYNEETNFEITSSNALPTLDMVYAITNRDFYSKEETNDIIYNTKYELSDQINNSNYYDEITYVEERHDHTDCYIATIPKYDNGNNQINVYVDKDDNKTPNEYAISNKTTLTTNAGLTYQNEGGTWKQGIVIGNGQILNQAPNDITYRDDNVYIGFTEDRQLLEFQANQTTAQQMLDAGVKNAFLVFYRYMNNGELEEHTDVPNWTTESPRMDFGIKENGDIIILACDGRTDNNAGLTNEQALAIMQSKGCVRAWRGDGGGSASLNIKENKVNRNIDDNGTTDRKITVNFNVKKETVNAERADIYGEISKQKQLLNKQIRKDLLNVIYGVEYQEGKMFMRINNNSLNNPVGTTYENMILEGIYRHGETVRGLKNDNNQLIGFNLNKNGMFRIVVVASFESNSAGDRSIKITKGDTDTTDWQVTVDVTETGTHYRQIVCDTVVNNSTGAVMPIKLWRKGQVGDRWLKITAYCEDLGNAESA